jgi:hypothetical protein
MKNLIFLMLILFCACKRESTGPQYPCPPEGEKSAYYMCADISDHESFVTIGANSFFTQANGLAGVFYNLDNTPCSQWTLSGHNNLMHTVLAWGISYPFTLGEKITKINGTYDESSGPNMFIIYRPSKSISYSTDSLSKGWLIIKRDSVNKCYFGTFEADLGNEKNIKDRIKVTNGRFYLGGTHDYYTIQD